MSRQDPVAPAGTSSPRYDLVVVGLGYVGLPLARAAVAAGLSVAGYDTAPHLIEALSGGRSHVDDVSDEVLQGMLEKGFAPSSDPRVIADAAAIAICVPTPLLADRTPDLTAVRAAAAAIAPRLRAGALVVLESTTYPGTTQEVLLPALALDRRRVGADFFLAFSPERVDPGNPRFGVHNTPKIIGGVTAQCSDHATALYSRFVAEVVVAKGPREAEMAKLLENTYRHVNIALMNELARFAHEMNIDIWDVIRCASTKPFGFQPFYPGPGVGGHCIPIDPNYLAFSVRSSLGTTFRFVELAEEINLSMPAYVVQRVQNQLNERGIPVNGASVLLVGVTYKANISDTRETPAREVAQRFMSLGANVSYFDPLAPGWDAVEGVQEVTDGVAVAAACDIVVLLNAHASVDVNALVLAGPRTFDARGLTRGPDVERL